MGGMKYVGCGELAAYCGFGVDGLLATAGHRTARWTYGMTAEAESGSGCALNMAGKHRSFPAKILPRVPNIMAGKLHPTTEIPNTEHHHHSLHHFTVISIRDQ